MMTDLQRVTLERDAAIADLRALVGRYCLCYRCTHDDAPDYDICHDCQDNNWRGWEWKSPVKEATTNAG